jgi:DNA-binding FadR family transcriptional regulator
MANGQDPDPWEGIQKFKAAYEAFQAAIRARDWEAADQALADYLEAYQEAVRLLERR